MPGRRLRPKSQVAGFGRGIHRYRLAVMHRALQQQAAQRRFDLFLNGPLQRTRAVMRVVARAHQIGARSIGEFERDVTVRQARPQAPKLDLDDLFQVLLGKRVEHDGLVHAVQELRPEMAPHLVQNGRFHALVPLAAEAVMPGRPPVKNALASDIGGHDHDGVLEIHGAALPVGEAPVIQHLQHHVEHIVVRLFDFVEQHHRVRPAAHRFGQLSALFVTHVSGRRPDQPRHRVLLLVLGHVELDHGVLVVEQVFGQRARQFGLAHAGGPEKDEAADRPVGIVQARPRANHGFRHRRHRLILPHHPLVKLGFQVQQLVHLAFQQLGHGNPGPAAHHFGDILLVHLFLDEPGLSLLLRKTVGVFLQLALQRSQLAVFQLGGAIEIVLPLRPLDFHLGLLHLLAKLAQAFDRVFLALPARGQGVGLGLEIRQFFLQLGQPLFGSRILFLAQGLALDFELHDAPPRLIQLRGHGIDLRAQPRGRFIHQVDRLVRQKPFRNVAVGEYRGRHQRRVLDAHAVMHFVALLQPAQNRNGVLYRGLVHQHRLEPALEGRILLDVLAVFVQRGGADAVELAARQHGLKQVAGVHRALRLTRAHYRVQLVDEQDDFTGRFLHLLQHCLETFLEFAAVLGARDQRAHVERHDALVLEPLRDIAANDPLAQTFDDCRLSDARLADQHRVVLGPPREHLDDAADLFVAPDHRIELALCRQLRQVAPIALQRLVGALGVLGSDALVAAHLAQRLHQPFAVEAEFLQQPARRAAVLDGGQQHVLHRDVLVLELARFVIRIGQQAIQAARDVHLVRPAGWAGDLGHPLELGFHPARKRLYLDSCLGQDGRSEPALLLQQGGQKMFDVDLLVAVAYRFTLRRPDPFLELLREPIDVHTSLCSRNRRHPVHLA
ncbi:conserved hypothetical protein [Candidatus Sulfopaludibacter sp. SbA6]|nr:conserved hypothetical protein [Candidatus Sulfopaludibacter sp. SbA6]